MLKLTNLIFIILLLGLVFETNAQNETKKSFIPLAIGNYWIYSSEYHPYLHDKKAEIKITDMLGQIVLLKKETAFDDGNLSSTLNIAGMASGIYFVSVNAGVDIILRKLVAE